LGKTGNILHFPFFWQECGSAVSNLGATIFFELGFKEVLLSFWSLISLNTQLGPLYWLL
jgi:hypothetical protein